MTRPKTSAIDFPSGAVAKLSIIETGTRLSDLPISLFLGPPLAGFENLPTAPSWSFLVESSTDRKVVFDLAVPKGSEAMTPLTRQLFEHFNASFDVPKDVAQVLEEGGVLLESIEAIIWSHWHMDHIGDPSTFPNSTDIVVGPRAREEILPTYPEREDATVHENIIKGKTIREIGFDGALKFYGLNVHDYFGDGSFYLVDLPGHALGHIGGLVRTTSNPDTFVILSGDMYHTAAELRPNAHKPLPEEGALGIHVDQTAAAHEKKGNRSCLCSMFEQLQVKRGRKLGEPFFEIVDGHDVEAARHTLEMSQFPDAQDHLLFISAHDDALIGAVDFFPQTANNWKALGWKEKIDWHFLGKLREIAEGDLIGEPPASLALPQLENR